MAARLGIELSPTACRIIEIAGAPRWGRLSGDTRVQSFTVLPPSGADTDAKLASLKGQDAAVIVWNAPSEHRQVVVTGGSYESMRSEALSALAAAGLQTTGVVADIAPAGGRPKRGARQPVVVTLASAAEMSAALEPLRAAGIHLRTVTTPAVALDSLARLRRRFSVPGAIEAYVALEPGVICVALVRDSVLVAARDLRWGYGESNGSAIAIRPRDEIAERLVADISEFVTAIGGEPHDIGQVCVTGGLPELRSMTAQMTEHLDVEVEPLDSMSGIDAAHLPEPAEEFRDRGAELRLAWAVAADWPPAINLLRARHRRVARNRVSRAAIAAGVAAGLLVGWRVQQSQWWQSTAPKQPPTTVAVAQTQRGRTVLPAGRSSAPQPAAATTRPSTPAPATAATTRPSTPTQATAAATRPAEPSVPATNRPAAPVQTLPPSSTSVAANRTAAVVPPRPEPAARGGVPVTRNEPAPSPAPPHQTPARPVPSPQGAPPTRTEPSRQVAAAAPRPILPAPTLPRPTSPAAQTAAVPVQAVPPPVRREPPSASATPQASAPARVSSPVPVVPQAPSRPPAVADAPRVSTAPSSPPLSRSAPEPIHIPPVQPARAERPKLPASPEVALPFEAALGTILYSPDRKLAIVDGRIVGVGDEVRGARIVDITQTSVMLRDGAGRLRRLTLGAAVR